MAFLFVSHAPLFLFAIERHGLCVSCGFVVGQQKKEFVCVHTQKVLT